MSAKLHELLAVETSLENQAEKKRTELISTTFDKKRGHFAEKRVTFQPNTEGSSAVVEEQSEIQTTVAEEIGWLTETLAQAIDVSHAIDVANTEAKADVVTEDGTTILQNIPATSLLALESRLGQVHQLIQSIPTLDPVKGFRPDGNRKHGIFVARDVNKQRTKKVQKPLVLAPATDKHAAQVQLITEDVVVGTIQEQEWSSLITPATKSLLLERCETLQRAVKKARARANQTEVNQAENKIGARLLDFVFKPLYAKTN